MIPPQNSNFNQKVTLWVQELFLCVAILVFHRSWCFYRVSLWAAQRVIFRVIFRGMSCAVWSGEELRRSGEEEEAEEEESRRKKPPSRIIALSVASSSANGPDSSHEEPLEPVKVRRLSLLDSNVRKCAQKEVLGGSGGMSDLSGNFSLNFLLREGRGASWWC